jgi:hypothetical protein
MSSIIHATAHGLVAGDPVRFGNLVPTNTGIDETVTYYVLAAGLTADAFEFSETDGGTPVVLAYPITDGLIRNADDYSVVADGIMDPPDSDLGVASALNVSMTTSMSLGPDGTVVPQITCTFPPIGAFVADNPTQPDTLVFDLAEDFEFKTKPQQQRLKYDPSIVSGADPTTRQKVTFTGLVAGRTYYARVYLTDIYTNSTIVTPGYVLSSLAAAGDTTAPAVPTSLAAAAGILMNMVSWVKVTDADLDHYDLAISTDGGSTFPTVRAVYTTVVALSDLTADQAYVYKVRAVDSSGNASAYTSTVTATPRKVTGSGLSGTDIKALSIDGAEIKAAAITAAKIAAGTITANEIAADTILAGNIAASAITSSELAAGAVVAGKIAAGTIVAADIAADTITAANIAASAITSSELAANAVIAGKIAAGTIVTGDLNATCSISLVSNSGATVVIDSTGITITNGKLTLQDEWGSSVIGASGFSGNWTEFILSGLYNGAFRSGVAGTVGLGRTSALPYWTVSNVAGTPTLTFVGPGIKCKWAAIDTTKMIVSDFITVLPGSTVEAAISLQYNRTSGGVHVEVEVETWDTTQTFAVGLIAIDETLTASTSGIVTFRATAAIPTNAYYYKVKVRLTEKTTHNSANEILVYQVAAKVATGPNFDVVTYAGLFSAFPHTPVTGDLRFRSDVDMWFKYNGSQWLCTCKHIAQFSMAVTATLPLAATATNRFYCPLPVDVGLDILIESYETFFNVRTGGTALGASHKWVDTIAAQPSGTTIATLSIASGASAAYRTVADSGDDTLDITSADVGLTETWTKTGTPGDLEHQTQITYRFIGV